ncbi:ArsB/NhaD family transporter [Candidatus Bipolaricaulota bacterium]|nr:ArsB/NhaD family transporter [Candidatus Bipolaricaulota bacterium]
MDTPGLACVIASTTIFVLTYAVILSEKLHRTIVALTGAAAMVAIGTWLGFYDLHVAVAEVDFNTILLLMGMMIVVGLFKETGFFQYLAIRAAKLAKGRPVFLLIYLGAVTSLISMVLDNVTTIIILVPVTISMADILGLPAMPFLISEVILSNIGGVATLIGDPPNILIGSAAGFSFTDFLIHLAPIVLVVWAVAQVVLVLMFRKSLRSDPEMRNRLMALDERRAIINHRTTRKMLVVLGLTIVLFLIHERLAFDPGLVALIGACIGLVWVRPDLESILRDIHWDVLLFFSALFVIVGGLDAAGVLSELGEGLQSLAEWSLLGAVVVVLWGGALASGVLSNVPFTIAMLPILQLIVGADRSLAPLWWALALGVGFGANLSPIGAASNVVVSSLAVGTGERFGVRDWLKRGTVVSLVSCVIATAGLLLAVGLGWM